MTKALCSCREKIRGESWTFRVLAEPLFTETYGQACAITHTSERKIDISIDYLEFCTILHEVFHAYASYLHLQSAESIKSDDVEEIYAELISKYAIQMIMMAIKVHVKLAKKAKPSTAFYGEGITEDQHRWLDLLRAKTT